MLELDQIQHLHLATPGEMRKMGSLHDSHFFGFTVLGRNLNKDLPAHPKQIYPWKSGDPGVQNGPSVSPRAFCKALKGSWVTSCFTGKTKHTLPKKNCGGFLKFWGFFWVFNFAFGVFICLFNPYLLGFFNVESILRSLYLFSPFITL